MPRQLVPEEQRAFARKLRKAAGVAETRLWHELRAGRLDGWKFRRQVPLDRYVADFVCFEARLIVEVDGPLHARPEAKLHDERRDADLGAAGFRILRLPDDLALAHMLDSIRNALPPPHPSRR